MKRRNRLTFWNYWLAWISANALAWTVGFGVAQLYARLLYGNDRFIQQVLEGAKYIWTRPLESPVASANYGLMLGAAVGLGQWFVLRRRFDIKLLWWVTATGLGFAIHGLILGLDVSLLSDEAGAASSLGLLCASVVLVGVPQWFVLRPHLPGAGWWVLASAVALTLASPDRSGGTDSLLVWLVVSLGAGVVYGIVTAFALFFLTTPANKLAAEGERQRNEAEAGE